MTTPDRVPIPAWVCLCVCVAATVFDLIKVWTADTTADRLVFLSLAAFTAVVGVWWWRVTATLSGLRRPEGVTIHHPDGTTTVCELAYVGIEDGLHTWAAATPYRPGRDQVTIEMLPAHSCVRFLIPDTGLRDTDSTNTREDPREPPPPHRRHL